MSEVGVSPGEIESLERCALGAWPALESRDCMGWALRSANGYTKRANSANALAPTGDFGALRRETEAHYTALGLPAIFRLSPLAQPGADAALAAARYALVEPSLVMTASLDRAADNPDVVIEPFAESLWLEGFGEAVGEASEATLRHAAILDAIEGPHAFASIVRRGRPIAFGLAVVDQRRVGLFDIAVHPAHRGNGFARTLSAALLSWGRAAGAHGAYLQVRRGNGAALRTYTALGFTEAYGYHYRVRAPAHVA